MLLVERDVILDHLNSLSKLTKIGHDSNVVLIDGGVGVGKTAILTCFADLAHSRGAVVLAAAGSPAQGEVAAGVLAQLLGAAVPEPRWAQLLEWLADSVAAASLPHRAETFDARVLHRVSCGLTTMAREAHLVVCIDDIQHIDAVSAQFMLHFIRASAGMPVTFVLTETPGVPGGGAELHDCLARHKRMHRFTLRPLSPDGVRAVLTEALGPAVGGLTERAVWLTGGNPLLLFALTTDLRETADRQVAPGTVTPGEIFQRAYRSCLRASGELARSVVTTLAVLGDAATSLLVARLTKTDIAAVETVADSLNQDGLLSWPRFRHPAARDAVLAGADRGELAALHSAAARVLFETGAPAREVARHLVASGMADEPFAGPVLAESAEQALLTGQVEDANTYLYAVDWQGTDEPEQVDADLALSTVEWRINPTAAVRRLPRLASAVIEGRLVDHRAVAVAENLLWHGEVADAEHAFVALAGSVGTADVATRAAFAEAVSLLAHTFPGVHQRLGTTLPQVEAEADQPQPGLDASSCSLLTFGRARWLRHDEQALAAADTVLRNTPVNEGTLARLMAAVATLVAADRGDQAVRWCEHLRRAIDGRHGPAWRVVLDGLRGVVALRGGRLADAETHARAALSGMPASVWGVAVAVPLATALSAATAQGRRAEATELVEQSVPALVFESVFGLDYLAACGEYHLASHQFRIALDTFTQCGELAAAWGTDLPGLPSWRLGAARASLGLGDRERARRLLEEELGDTPSRDRGASLRLLATVNRRPVEVDPEPEHDLPLPRSAQGRHGMPTGDGRTRVTTLTEAERRVSAMAAQGSSNKEIAEALSITVSTVEQHLTRSYRKLAIRRRRDLPHRLLAVQSETDSADRRWVG